MTAAQRHALSVIAWMTLLQGRAPTLGELAQELQIQKPSVFERLYWLEKKGLWQRPGSITRAGLSAIGLPASAPTNTPLGR